MSSLSSKLILHLGASKCGSSALQTALSLQPEMRTRNGGKTVYAAITKDGECLTGRSLIRHTHQNRFGYISSVSARQMEKWADKTRAYARSSLKKTLQSTNQLILSNEAWVNELSYFQSSGLFDAISCPIDVVLYVRPPVDWMNSAWWQWGAWTKAPLRKWARMNLRLCTWSEALHQWETLPQVKQCRVRLLPSNITSDFYELLNVDTSSHEKNRSNTSLPGTLLRLIQMHPDLRPGAHASLIDFVLARHIRELQSPTPWVINQDLAQWIIEQTLDSNKGLQTWLNEAERKIMAQDPRWWDASAYREKTLVKPRQAVLSRQDLDAVAYQAIQSVIKLDEENYRLRGELERAKSGIASFLRSK